MKRPVGMAVAIALGTSAQAGAAKENKPKIDPEAVRVMHQFGRCVGESRSNAKLLGTLPYSPDEGALAARMSRNDCLRSGGELRFRAPVLRGLVAEQLYVQFLSGDRPRTDVAPVFVALFKTSATSEREREAYSKLKPALSQCIEPGATFRMNPFTLRGFLAEGAYRHALEEAKKPNA